MKFDEMKEATDIAIYCYLTPEEERELKENGYITAGKLENGKFVSLMTPSLFVQGEKGLVPVAGRTIVEKVKEEE